MKKFKDISVPKLEGKNILLRKIRKSDLNRRYLSWLKDKQVIKFTELRFASYTMKGLESFYRGIMNSQNDYLFAIVLKENHQHVGNIKLGYINWEHRYAELGILIGDKKCWGKGYGREAVRLLLDYAFNSLRLNKVILGVYGAHQSAIRSYKKAGFRAEGRLKKMYKFNGSYTDKVYMGISASQFKKTKIKQ